MLEGGAPRRVRLIELGSAGDTAYLAFQCDPGFETLLWDERVLTLSATAGVRWEPEALAAGFLFALAPLGWTHGAEISTGGVAVPEEAVRCLDRVGRFLRDHYRWPAYEPFREVRTRPMPRYPRSHRALMWSGGVDSAYALARLDPRTEIDWLVHLSNFENLDSRTSAAQQAAALAATRRTADERGLGWLHLRTNLAGIFKHNRFDDRFPPECSFWLGLEHLQHLATALTVVRPLLAGVFVAGGFSELHHRVGSCTASKAFVDLYDYPAPLCLVDELEPRQRKVEFLVDRAPELLRSLRVCYSSGDGACAHCRKCQATALMIVAAGGDLAETSFPPAIVSNLLARIEEIRELPPEQHRFFNQALEGRCLAGSRNERWRQLIRRLEAGVPRQDRAEPARAPA